MLPSFLAPHPIPTVVEILIYSVHWKSLLCDVVLVVVIVIVIVIAVVIAIIAVIAIVLLAQK